MAKKGLPRPTIDRIKEVLICDPDAGKLYWAPRTPEMFNSCQTRGAERAAQWAADAYNGRFAGKEAFTAYSNGYLIGAVDGKNMRSHTVIWAMYYGEWPSDSLDHINGKRDDNRICNLRLADGKTNGRNHGMKKNNTSGHTGVQWCKCTNRWLAAIKINYKHVNLGRYDTFEEAVAVRERAKLEAGFSADHGLRPAYGSSDY